MKAMSNVDIYAICKELGDLLKDARVQKAYQPTKDTVLIRFHVPSKGRVDVIFQAGLRVHTTQYPPQNPKVPPNFPMLLRKYIKGGRVTGVSQHNFDRIMRIDIQKEHKFSLVIELFAKGNIILLDEDDQIILPLKRKLWQDRKISSKEEYKYPPERGINPLEIKKDQLKEIFQNSDRDIIRTLAGNGLGGLYAEEIILRSNVDKKKMASEVTDDEINALHSALNDVFKPIKTYDFKPQIVSGKKDDVLPLDLQMYSEYEKKRYETFNEASDEFYSSIVGEDIVQVHNEVWSGEVGKFEKRLAIQLATLEKFNKTVKDSKIKGEAIYSNYQNIQNIINIINEAREKHSWLEIISIIKKAKKAKTEGLEIIESIDKMGVLTLNLDGIIVNIDTGLGIPENAEVYYNKGKKAKKKIRGVNIAIAKTEEEIKKAKGKREIEMEKVLVPQKRVKKDLKWYEKLRWFLTSDGLMVIGGRDATTNEMVVKKHMENRDIYFHSDIHGAASIILKAGKDEIPESSINQAAAFAACFSSAWAKGLGSADVYWVHPEQVSKTPQSGEFVTKGAFIIRGSRNYIRGLPLTLAIGKVDYEGERIMAGPPEAVSKYTENFASIKPGYTKKEEIAMQIKNKIDTDKMFIIEDVVRVLPSGKCDFVDKKGSKRKRR
ncbi:ribosome rescue protein RqcH [Methanobacterium spitsbergense]|uniref:Archaeal Rqc2 homolog aRqcH n=1 Tax=Methanobacterium spitsbergense TaxID=2874285 RepID=A0A8T5UZE8_9EURY|nr:ribosome rescue protein RqcH [Methanobacterium spitsbergense]MBZ2166183.1 NFACT family protein [Methanobacterium spitsbergense]